MNWGDYAKDYFNNRKSDEWKINTDYYIPERDGKEVAEELDLRENHDAVKDAWEQYQTVLRLARK